MIKTHSVAVALSLIALIMLFFGVQSKDSPPSCKTCQSPPPIDDEDDEVITLCRCDEQCAWYGDCCPDADTTSNFPIVTRDFLTALQYMECHSRYKSLPVSAVGDAYYMVSSCPVISWTQDEQFAEIISYNCTSTDPDIEDFPPVSDPSTGITYRNEFCAICHNVNTSTLLTWPTRLQCDERLKNISQTQNITLELIYQYCSRCSFDPPNSTVVMDTLRWCIPVEAMCPPFSKPGISDIYNETEYEEIVDSCEDDDFNPIYELPMGEQMNILLQNYDCAKCKLVLDFSLRCIYPTQSQDSNSRCTTSIDSITFGPVPFSVLLDYTRGGVVNIRSTQIMDTDLIKCEEHQVFDPVIGCRDIACPSGYIFTSGACMLASPSPPPTMQADNGTMIVSGGNNGMNIVNYANGTLDCYNDTLENCTGSIVSLIFNMYTVIDNFTVLYRGQEYEVIEYNSSNGQPLICIDARKFKIPEFPAGYIELNYLGKTLSLLSSIFLFVTFSVFKELRTLPSKLLLNLAVAFIVSDVLFIVSGFVNRLGPISCFFSTIVFNFFILSRFSWMNCLGIEYTRTIYMALSLRAINSSLSKVKIFIVYIVIGWAAPAINVVISLVVNFTIKRSRGSSDQRQGLCWMNGEAQISAYIVPISLSTMINIVLFCTVIGLICIASKSSAADLRSKHNVARIRVTIGIFSVLGMTWVFGFISLLAQNSWAWYVFAVFNSIQPVIIAVSFLATRKIALLYICQLRKFVMKCNILCKKREPQANEPLANEHSLEKISTVTE